MIANSCDTLAMRRRRPAVGDDPVARPAAIAAANCAKKKSGAALGAHAPTDKDTNLPARNTERADVRYLYAAVDRAGVALASTRYLTTPWVRPVADLIIAK
jgi:hypothetical protein